MMGERGLCLAHTTIMRWIQRYVPEFEKRWNRFACLADDPGVLMKPMSKSEVAGPISIVRSTKKEKPSISASRQAGCRHRQGVLSQGFQGPGRTAA
jgi:hypothetical protein